MTSPLPYTTGTVTLAHGSADVVGNGTSWALSGVRGGVMTVEAVGGNPLVLATVTDDTTATAATRWMGPSGTYAYAISLASAEAADTVWASRHWSRVVGGALLSAIPFKASGTEAERGALNPPLETGEWFGLAEVDSDEIVAQLKVPDGWRDYRVTGEAGIGTPGADGKTGDMSYGIVAAVSDPEGSIAAAEYEIDDYVTTSGEMMIVFGRIRDGDVASEVDFYVAVNGAPAYGPVTAMEGAQFVAADAGILLDIGDKVSLVVTAVIGDVRDFFVKVGIGAVA